MKRTFTLNKSSPLKNAKIVASRQKPKKRIFLSLLTMPRARAYPASRTKTTASFGYHASKFTPQSLPYFVVYSKFEKSGKSQKARSAIEIPKTIKRNLKLLKISFFSLCKTKKIADKPPIIAVTKCEKNVKK